MAAPAFGQCRRDRAAMPDASPVRRFIFQWRMMAL
jgi:hypothetical protein